MYDRRAEVVAWPVIACALAFLLYVIVDRECEHAV